MSKAKQKFESSRYNELLREIEEAFEHRGANLDWYEVKESEFHDAVVEIHSTSVYPSMVTAANEVDCSWWAVTDGEEGRFRLTFRE